MRGPCFCQGKGAHTRSGILPLESGRSHAIQIFGPALRLLSCEFKFFVQLKTPVLSLLEPIYPEANQIFQETESKD